MHVLREDQIHTGRNRDSNEREQICGRNDAALVFLLRLVLNQRVDRYGKEPGPETEHAEE